MKFESTSIEQVQEYWDRRPCNIRHSPKPVGTREYFDEVEARKYFVEPHIPRFAQFERWRGRKVLEIGCGIGTDTVNFARNGAMVTAVDLSGQSLEVARRRVAVYELKQNVSFYQGSAEELRQFLPIDEYELIYSFGVIHHTPHPERVMEELQYYAGPNTTLKIMLYHRCAWKVFSILMSYGKGQFWKASEIVAKHSEAQTGCPVTFTYTRRSAKELIERNGFHVIEMWVDHIFSYRVANYTQFRYVKALPFRWMPAQMLKNLEKRFGWHLCVTATRAEVAA